MPARSVRRSGASVNEGGAAARRWPVAPMPMPPSNVPTIIDQRIARPPNGMAPPSLRPTLGSRTIDASLPWRADRSRRYEIALRVANDRACEHSLYIGWRRSGVWHRVLGASAGVAPRLGAAHVPGA